jgi:preprotein translocase subunit SecG
MIIIKNFIIIFKLNRIRILIVFLWLIIMIYVEFFSATDNNDRDDENFDNERNSFKNSPYNFVTNNF